jgi:carbon starvation protein CstA
MIWHPVLLWVLIGTVFSVFLCGFLFLHFRPKSKHKVLIRQTLFVAIKTFTYFWVIPILVLILAVLAIEVLKIRVKFLTLYLITAWGTYTLIYLFFCLLIDLPKQYYIKLLLVIGFFGVPIYLNLILVEYSEERLGALFPVCYCALYFVMSSIFNKLKKE